MTEDDSRPDDTAPQKRTRKLKKNSQLILGNCRPTIRAVAELTGIDK